MKKPGPIVVGAVQGASCFGPAYEFAFILDTALRRAKTRDQVPMTFVTPEPYIGHLGLDGVGDTKGLLESAMRERHIKWITNAKVTKVEPGKMFVEEVDEDGAVKATHELPFAFSMMLPAFRGVPAIHGIEGLTNPRGFVAHRQAPAQSEIPERLRASASASPFPPVGKTPLPVGVPKTGFMIESMVTATAENIAALLRGEQPKAVATWNAVCLADFGDEGIAFVAQPQIPPRNVNWSSLGQVGARRQDRLREVLPPQGPAGQGRDLLREPRPRRARHQEAQGAPPSSPPSEAGIATIRTEYEQ